MKQKKKFLTKNGPVPPHSGGKKEVKDSHNQVFFICFTTGIRVSNTCDNGHRLHGHSQMPHMITSIEIYSPAVFTVA